jgi:hypothetical protein
VRLAVPVGYGLGRRGSVPVTFALVDPASGARLSGALPYDLRVIRMQDRLGARMRGVDTDWKRVERPGSPVALAMVPGKYYVYCETRTPEGTRRGIEIKFHVHDPGLVVDVPLPEEDRARYGSFEPH